jgi:hypothetical protein
MTINRAVHLLGVTHRAAALNVQKLVEAGLLVEVKSMTRTRLFLAAEILRTINGEYGVR